MSRPATRNLCPVCAKPSAAPHSPFCSQGCRDRDLLQWLGEGYRIPGPAADPGLDTPDSHD
ncbi:DNA gyrase inhibitor YacG [Sphingomonas sp. Leaf33]|uniref:DNA gyrase inhibitor YacG n=1 Tax=Sphingomonas sp. Leaf33 TaxID=1736215 RepID=UPI0009E8DBA3|nr:DNA gyrase inhibitor YacG [Sphingomonas sp. Leaf33]